MQRTTSSRQSQRRSGWFMNFIKNWGIFIIVIALIILSRLFIWNTARVDGNSMDPTLANGQRLIMTSLGTPKRFDVVVAQETTAQTQKNDPSATKGITIVKRIIGMPGDTVSYHDDTLTINGKVYNEPYLKDYQLLFANNQLADHYSKLPLTSNLTSSQRSMFVSLAKTTKAFTTDNTGNPNFTMKVPDGQYLLLGDDRVVSADSRKVGTFTRDQIKGRVLFRIWPLNKIGGI